MAAVGFDDSFCNCHTQAGAFGFGREKRLEDPLLLLGTQPGSIIAESQLNRRLSIAVNLGTSDMHVDGSIAGGQGVVQDIAENLAEPKRIDPHAKIESPQVLR